MDEPIETATTEEAAPEEQKTEQDKASQDYLEIARAAYEKSTSFMDNNIRMQLENNLRHFQSRHHSGSKYLKPSYMYRSKIFRPKTRSAIRNQEAAAVAAFFSNRDVVSIEPQNDNDPRQKASAGIVENLLQYRLTKTLPWFLLCVGAYQDAMVQGAVIAYVDWEYEELEGETIKDQPVIRLVPLENFRFDPAADWMDPVGTSPYLIELIPMYVIDVLNRTQIKDPKTGEPGWKDVGQGVIEAATKQRYDSTRQTREHPRTDSKDSPATGGKVNLYDIVWVHRNIIKGRGGDAVFYTLGTEFLLSDPVPIKEAYWTGERPYVMGICVLETHKVIPSGLGQLGENVQKELNDNANSRSDNIKLVLNKRYLVRRGSQTDLRSIIRNAAGSITMVNNTGGENPDVKPMEFNDVTPSAFQEQDRLNVDFDEVVGNFSTSTIQTNRKLNETVGGMAMLRGNVNAVTEYNLRTFGETFVEPLMRKLVKLEQRYETDFVILALAAEKAGLFQKYNINRDTLTEDQLDKVLIEEKLLDQELTTTVTVGMGATDPLMKMQHFATGLKIIVDILVAGSQGPIPLNVMEVAKEVFGFLGFKDSERFLRKELGPDPEKMQMEAIIQQMQAVIEQLQKKIDDKALDAETKLQLEKIRQMGNDRRLSQQIQASFAEKVIDLQNPVAGEEPPKKEEKEAANG